MKVTENKNCNKCKKDGLFRSCDILKNNKKYQELIEKEKYDLFQTGVFEFKNNYVCDEFDSRFIQYPIEVTKIDLNSDCSSDCRSDCSSDWRKREIGQFVKIKPCGDEYKDKTYLGIYLGDLPIGHSVSHNTLTGVLNIGFRKNPAILVPDLKKIIYGMESWWSIIEKEEDLKNISKKMLRLLSVKSFKGF